LHETGGQSRGARQVDVPDTQGDEDMATVERVSVENARRAATAGRALLVCAYEDDAKCRQVALEGALSFSQFKAREGALSKEQEIVFYCA
jgi:hypothetical protein